MFIAQHDTIMTLKTVKSAHATKIVTNLSCRPTIWAFYFVKYVHKEWHKIKAVIRKPLRLKYNNLN